jgi:two-component system response regulator
MSNRKILLVEDDPNDETLILLALEEGKFTNEIDVVRDGEEALDFLFRKGKYENQGNFELPQVVLLDLMLPKIDGLDVLKAIRANPKTRSLPVVIMTSSEEENDLVSTYESGANSYIVKPISKTQFMDSVEQVGLYWLIVNKVPPAGSTKKVGGLNEHGAI